MNSTTSTKDRHASGRFAAGNAGGPGNPFARKTAALRAYLINHVTEQDLQDILDILLLNAKGGHLPTIKFLFSYVLGKPQPAINPDVLDLQEMHLFQQGALPPEALETVCDQLPLDFQVQLTRFTQAENAATAVQTALDNNPDAAPPSQRSPPSDPSTDGDDGEPRGSAAVEAPSTDGDCRASEVAKYKKPPSSNGKIRRPPNLAGFDWLGNLRRAFGRRKTT